MSNNNYILYILECADSSLYTGISNNLEKRLKMHRGELPGGAKYTSGRRPVILVYSEVVGDRSRATKREIEVKKMSKKQKLELIYRFKNIS